MRGLAWSAVIAVVCCGAMRAAAAEADAWVSAGGKHDGQPWRYGWLKQVPSGDAAAPYALFDRHGRVRCYITPDAGVDVTGYVGEHVRLQGPVMAASADGVTHVSARQVRALVGNGSDAVAVERTPSVRSQHSSSKSAFRLATAEEPVEPRRFVVPATAQEITSGPALTPPRPFSPAPRATLAPASNSSESRARIARPATSGRGPRWEPIRTTKQEEIRGMSPLPDPTTSPIPEGVLVTPLTEEGFEAPYAEEAMVDGPSGPPWGESGPFPRRFWVRGEYLFWETQGMNVPPLVTTSVAGTARADAGVLGEPNTSVLFGGDEIFDETRSGGRIRFGTWLDSRLSIGLQGEFFMLQDEEAEFTQSSNGNPIIARPFFDINQAVESAELIAFPNVVSGTIGVDASSSLMGAGALAQFNVVCRPRTWSDPYRGHTCYGGVRVAALAGYRFLRLDDSLSIREELTSLDPMDPGSFVLQDNFDTQNNFHGVDLGMLIEWRRCRWSLELLTRVALGNNQEIVTISGSSDITEGGVTESFDGGLLAQRSNIGKYKRNQFAVVPELGITLGYQLTPQWRLTAGYTFLYWSRVARAGDQIDLDLNTNLIPPETQPFTGPLRPRALLTETDYWAQGLHAGIDCQW